MRDRKLDPDEVAEMWNAVQSNMGKFQRYFGRTNFILIDNNNATEKIFDKVYVEIGKLIDKKPTSPKNGLRVNWLTNLTLSDIIFLL